VSDGVHTAEYHLSRGKDGRAGFTRLAWADALKVEVAMAHGISVAELNARKAEFRAELQRVGVARREEDPRYWIKRWVEARARIPGQVVNTDTRFPNEGFYAIQSGGLLVRLTAPDEVRLERLRARDGSFDPAALNHISEQYIDELPWQVSIECVGDQDFVRLISAGYLGLLAAKEEQRRAA